MTWNMQAFLTALRPIHRVFEKSLGARRKIPPVEILLG